MFIKKVRFQMFKNCLCGMLFCIVAYSQQWWTLTNSTAMMVEAAKHPTANVAIFTTKSKARCNVATKLSAILVAAKWQTQTSVCRAQQFLGETEDSEVFIMKWCPQGGKPDECTSDATIKSMDAILTAGAVPHEIVAVASTRWIPELDTTAMPFNHGFEAVDLVLWVGIIPAQ